MKTPLLVVLTVAVQLLAGCSGRPLVPGERQALHRVFGEQVDYDTVRVHDGVFRRTAKVRQALREEGVSLSAMLAEEGLTDDSGEVLSESEAIKRFIGNTPAFALGNRIYFSRDDYLDNLAYDESGMVRVTDLSLLAHEMMHVWQHQHRDQSGYSLAAIILQNIRYPDRYAFSLRPGKPLLEYRFEQQGAIVELYVHCSYMPATPYFEQLREVVGTVFDLSAPMRGRVGSTSINCLGEYP